MPSQTTPLLLKATLQTPLGLLQIEACDLGLTAITFMESPVHIAGLARSTIDSVDQLPLAHSGPCQLIDVENRDAHIAAHLTDACQQLSDYFIGQRRSFDLKLAATGTAFQQRAWQQLRQIPYGQTWSYGQQALALGNGNASRAVGAANAKNPLAIVVPCHRVIASNQQLTGYAGGLSRKLALLQLERSFDKAE